MNTRPQHQNQTVLSVPRTTFPNTPRNTWIAVCAALLAAGGSALAQSADIRSQPTRLTIPDSGTQVNVLTNFIDLPDGSEPVTLSVGPLPDGVGVQFSQTSITEDTGVTLTISTTNVPSGEHVINLNAAGGATGTFNLILHSGKVWNSGTGNWSTPASWVGGVIPGASDDVLFSDVGSQSNATTTNSIVDQSVEISSLRFLQTNNTTRFHNVRINAGVTLAVTGTNGLRLLRDYTQSGSQMDVNITGEGSLVVSNAAANVGILIPNQVANRFDLSGLNTFVTDVSRIGLGDYRMYPQYENLQENGFGGNATFLIPRRFIPTVSFARTNIIRATYADPNDYLDPGIRNYSLTLANNEVGTTADAIWNLGITNAFFLDSICLVQSSAQSDPGAGGIRFNSAFASSNPVAYFRGTNGGRMSVFAIADQAGIGASGTGTKAIVNFSAGRVDALVDRLYMGRDRTNSSDNATAEATLTFAAGTFDVNTAIVGFQGQGDNQGTSTAFTRGTLNVGSNGLFVANTVLELGHTTASPGHTTGAEQGGGVINISAGGTVRANRISVGGVTKVSAANDITMNNGNLVVSNAVASADKPLRTLTMNNSTLVLHVDSSVAEPYVYATNLVTGGSGNVISLASVVGFNSFPAVIPLISYGSASPNFSLELPPGLFGYVVNNTANNTIDAVITTTAPSDLVWNGQINGNWDNATANWQGGSVFNNGDAVRFDDSASGTRSITVTGSVIPGPGGLIVSNSAAPYSFSGGSIEGTAQMTKDGTQSLTIDALSSLPLTILEGSVMGSGSIGSAVVTSNATLNFSGTISQLTSSGAATSSGTIANGVTIQAGRFLNSGTLEGGFAVNGGSVTNTGTINATGNSTVNGGSFLNEGEFNNVSGRLTIGTGGVLSGTGTIIDPDGGTIQFGVDGRLVIAAGGTLSPGVDGIGRIEVLGRLDLNNNSTTVIQVDLNNPATNDVVAAERWSTLQGTIRMENIGSTPFAIGQSFRILENLNGANVPNNPDNPNHIPVMSPMAPGVGMQWDLSEIRTNGIVSIIAGGTTPPALMSVFNGTNTLTFTWGATNAGFQLQVQTNSLSVGLSDNWVPVTGSEFTNRVDVTIDPEAPAVFYRLSNE